MIIYPIKEKERKKLEKKRIMDKGINALMPGAKMHKCKSHDLLYLY